MFSSLKHLQENPNGEVKATCSISVWRGIGKSTGLGIQGSRLRSVVDGL